MYVEADLTDHPTVQEFQNRFHLDPIILSDFQEIWGRYKKPYLQKRDKLNIFFAKKKGQLIKETPDAYGLGRGKHFYHIHAYNCIYECEYCYLQGYFHTPDLVLFLNHEDIINEMTTALTGEPVWFHAGEFSDSLALSHLTKELGYYHRFCEKHPEAFIELRTKSANIKELMKLSPLPNLITSFSLSPESIAESIDRKTPSIKSRIEAMRRLQEGGFQIALHLDPIIYDENFKIRYEELITELLKAGLLEKISYISLGVVRFTSDVHKEVKRNYPDSIIHHEKMVESFDHKIRYQKPMRQWMLGTVKEILLQTQVPAEKIYFCMEEHQ